MFLAEIIRYSESQEIRGTTGKRLPEQYTSVTWWVCKGIILKFFFILFYFFFFILKSHYSKNKNKTKRNQTKQNKNKKKKKKGVTSFLAVYCFPGSHFSTFNHNSFFNVCLFVCLLVIVLFLKREGVINWMACVIPATHSINYLQFWFCWSIEGRVNTLALFLFGFKVKRCKFLRKKKTQWLWSREKRCFNPFPTRSKILQRLLSIDRDI